MTTPSKHDAGLHFGTFPFKAMGGPCELKLYAATPQQLQRAADAAIAEVLRIERKYSRYRDDSVVTAINRAAGDKAVRVDDETAALLNYAHTAFEQSDGLFDITSGILRQAWDFKSGLLPDANRLKALCAKIGWDRLTWSDGSIYLPEQGMELDFGGFGKEYAADAAAGSCREAGVEHGLVELGGDIHVIGPHPNGQPWHIGLRDPRDPERAIHALNVHRGGLASSGDYERFMVVDGVRYCHILNPDSGWPIRNTLSSVSVLAPLCLVAGTGATVAMLKGEVAGREWLAELGLPHCWVMPGGEVGGTLVVDRHL